MIWLNSAAFNALRCSSREVLIYPPPQRTRLPGAAHRSVNGTVNGPFTNHLPLT